MLLNRLEFEGHHVEVYSKIRDEYDKSGLTITFTPKETFVQIVKRLAQYVVDEEVILAVKALENEMARRRK